MNSFNSRSDGPSLRLADELVPQCIDALAGNVEPDGFGVGSLAQYLVELSHQTLVVLPTDPGEEGGRCAIAVAVVGLLSVDLRTRNFGFVLPEPNVIGDSLDEPAGFVATVRIGLNDMRQFMNHQPKSSGCCSTHFTLT